MKELLIYFAINGLIIRCILNSKELKEGATFRFCVNASVSYGCFLRGLKGLKGLERLEGLRGL